MSANKTTVGYAVQLGGIAVFTLGVILSVHHIAIRNPTAHPIPGTSRRSK
jgi:hypothetical protein